MRRGRGSVVLGIALLGMITSAAALNRTAFRPSNSQAAIDALNPTATPTPTPRSSTPTRTAPSTPTPGIVCNGSTDATAAIQAAVNKGGTVTLPAGTCKLSAAIVMRNGSVTLRGTVSGTGQPLTTMVDTINPQYYGGDIQVKGNHNTVRNLILDQHRYGGALYVQGNYNVVSHDTILGGPSYFALFAVAQSNGAKAIGNQFLDDTSVALINRNVLGVSTQPCDDGFVLANQTGALVHNLDFTGTRLALYQDVSTTVNGFTYHPGPQTCGLDGFYITQPTSGITLENLNMHGSAGIISNSSPTHTPAQNVSITNEAVYPPVAGAGFTLNAKSHGLLIGNVSTVIINQSNFASGNPSNDSIQFQPTVAATGVTIEYSIVPKVSFWGKTPKNSTIPGYVSGLHLNSDTFPTPMLTGTSNMDETFSNGTGAPVSFSVSGGSWANSDSSDVSTFLGFYKGSLTATTCTVRNLAHFSAPSSPC